MKTVLPTKLMKQNSTFI